MKAAHSWLPSSHFMLPLGDICCSTRSSSTATTATTTTTTATILLLPLPLPPTYFLLHTIFYIPTTCYYLLPTICVPPTTYYPVLPLELPACWDDSRRQEKMRIGFTLEGGGIIYHRTLFFLLVGLRSRVVFNSCCNEQLTLILLFMDRIVYHRACIVTLDHHSNVLCQEVPGNIRSVPSALHGSLSLGPTLPLPRRRDSVCHLNCLSRNEDVVPFIHWEVEDGSRAASSPGHRLQFWFVSVACADIFFVVCLKIRRQLSDVQCRWWNRPAAVFCRTCRLQLLQLLCSSSGLCQRRLEHPVPAPAVMSSITGKFENCKQPDKGFWEFTPSKVQTLWTLRVIQANWNLVRSLFSLLPRSLQYPESQERLWCQTWCRSLRPPWTTCDFCRSAVWLTFRTQLHLLQSGVQPGRINFILFIFFLFLHGSLTFSNNVNLHEHFTYSFPFGQNLFVGSRFVPILYRENIIAELQWLTQSAIAGAQASKSESFATQTSKGPVYAWFERTTFSFTSVAMELNNPSLKLMGCTRCGLLLCWASWHSIKLDNNTPGEVKG